MASYSKAQEGSAVTSSGPCPFSISRTQKCLMIGGVINVFIVIVAYGAYQYFRAVPSEIVYTKLGGVQGVKGWSRNNNEFSQYLGIPYALKPERYEAPEPAIPWEGVRDGSYYRSICLQVEHFVSGFVLGDEDCLYLNVFKSHVGKTSNKAVMVYIHGGIFHIGGSTFAGPKYFMDQDIVLVTINYRVGNFGFLSTGDDTICGNMGLKDQNMALRFIRENIASFGGDPNKITLFGESAGGASVHHHLMSPASKGLFHKVIHQSGSTINYWAVYRNVKEQTKRFAEKFGCPTSTSTEIATCLKSLDAKTIVTAHRELMDFYRPQISTFVPTIESPKCKSPFLTEEPRKLLESGTFPKVSLMTGINAKEGQLISGLLMANQTKLNEANENWYQWAPWTLHYPESRTDISRKLREFYFGKAEHINSTEFKDAFTDMFGDRLFIVRGAVAARLESKFTPTYFYYYAYSGVFNAGELLANAQGDYLPHWLSVGIHVVKQRLLIFFDMLPKSTENACHSDEVAMLFNRDIIHTISPSHPDYVMSSDLVKLWTSFADGEPTLKFRNVVWHPNLNTTDVKYLKIGEKPAVISEPFEKRRLFWESLNLPNL